MAAARRVMELEFTEQELADLERVSRSRTEPASHVQRARILLGYRQTPSLYVTGRAIGVTHQTVERCLRRARDLGVKAALDDRPRPGRERTISSEARTFDLACRKPKDLDYPHEVWTTRLLTAHVRERGPQVGHACLARLSQGTLCKILAAHEIKPHKVKYYLQNRDPEFAEKMAEVLEVYREVETLKVAARAQKGDAPAVAIISCDEKPGIQALATTAPDLPPEPKVHETFARDQEYVRRGTMSLLAGLDLVTGVVHARVEEKTSLARVRRPSQTDRRGPRARDCDQAAGRQSLLPQVQGNPGLAGKAAEGTLRIHLPAQTRLLAQSHRRLLLQARPRGVEPHSRRRQKGAQTAHLGADRSHKPQSRRA